MTNQTDVNRLKSVAAGDPGRDAASHRPSRKLPASLCRSHPRVTPVTTPKKVSATAGCHCNHEKRTIRTLRAKVRELSARLEVVVMHAHELHSILHYADQHPGMQTQICWPAFPHYDKKTKKTSTQPCKVKGCCPSGDKSLG